MDTESTHQQQHKAAENEMSSPDVDFSLPAASPVPFQLQAGAGFEEETNESENDLEVDGGGGFVGAGSSGDGDAGADGNSGSSEETYQLARYPTSGRGRVRKPPFDQAIAELDYIERPQYRDSGIQGAGGKLSSATLGPTGSWLGQNSDANAALPRHIRAAREKYPDSHFKAGHLLNACFGGDGNNAANLTILSATGNANHKAFDEPVKHAVALLRKAYHILWKADIDVTTVGIGIYVTIEVDIDNPWPNETKIFSGLNCAASVTDTAAVLGDFQDQKLKNAFLDIMAEIETICIEATFAGEIANPP